MSYVTSNYSNNTWLDTMLRNGTSFDSVYLARLGIKANDPRLAGKSIITHEDSNRSILYGGDYAANDNTAFGLSNTGTYDIPKIDFSYLNNKPADDPNAMATGFVNNTVYSQDASAPVVPGQTTSFFSSSNLSALSTTSTSTDSSTSTAPTAQTTAETITGQTVADQIAQANLSMKTQLADTVLQGKGQSYLAVEIILGILVISIIWKYSKSKR